MKVLPFALRSAAIICFAFLLSSASCELFDKVDDVSIDVELKHTFIVSASASDPLTYAQVSEIDPTDNADFNAYKNKIKEITIHSVEYTVTNYVGQGEIIFSNGKGSFMTSGTSSTAIATADIAIQSIPGAVGTTKTLNYSIQDLDAIANELEKLTAVKFQVSGTVSKVPVAFNVPITIKMTIKADAL
jgi:hypothetical protein